MLKATNLFDLTAAQIEWLIVPGAVAFPELEAARADPAVLRGAVQTQTVLAQTQELMSGIARIPQTPYTNNWNSVCNSSIAAALAGRRGRRRDSADPRPAPQPTADDRVPSSLFLRSYLREWNRIGREKQACMRSRLTDIKAAY